MGQLFNLPAIVQERNRIDVFDANDVIQWRYCYEGGRLFRDRYLEKFSDRETDPEFARRKDLTPIPGYARKEINRVKNSLAQRFTDIARREGSKTWKKAVAGENRGVDLKGAGMNTFLTKSVLADLLVIGQIGVLVNAPKVGSSQDGAPSQSDVPLGFRPWLSSYSIEDYGTPIPASNDSPSDWSAVLLEDHFQTVNRDTMELVEEQSFRFYFLDDTRNNRVTIQKLDSTGTDQEPPVLTDLVEIPFVVFNIFDSLMRDACSYQVTMLNMISADSNYAIDANFPILTKQRGRAGTAAHLIGAEDSQEAGTRKGVLYDKDMNMPQFIAPPTGPMKAALELRRELKEEVHELVTGSVADLGEDGTLEAGLSFMGMCIESGENRLWDHWSTYEAARPDLRKQPVVSYPDDWSLKSDRDRLDEAKEKLDLSERLPGILGKQEAVVGAYEAMWRGKSTVKQLDLMIAEVKALPFTTSNPAIVELAADKFLADPETMSLQLGYADGVAKKAAAERDRRAASMVAAQMDAQQGAAKGVPEGSVDPNSNKEARAGDVEEAQIKGEPGVRGEGETTDGES